ncbi:MAG: hypothetical protein JO353_06075 [Phycisphaerae bacterium]|nr:hypothetical protein [Phycisphaerae bacterium]
MPTLPLFDESATVPGAWRRVMAPGGYQWWRLDAIDDPTQTVITVIFHDGRWSDPNYTRRYQRFIASPTKTSPPVPADFRAVEISVYQLNVSAVTELVSVTAMDFEASTKEMRVRIGNYALQPIESDRYRIAGPRTDLILTPVGRDGSLWMVQGSVLETRFGHGRGVLHSAFDVSPPKTRDRFAILSADRAMVGEGKTDQVAMCEPRILDEHRAVYRVENPAGVVIVDGFWRQFAATRLSSLKSG